MPTYGCYCEQNNFSPCPHGSGSLGREPDFNQINIYIITNLIHVMKKKNGVMVASNKNISFSCKSDGGAGVMESLDEDLRYT